MGRRVLVGACGSLTGSYLVRQFKKQGCTVIGADTSPHHVSRRFVDGFVQLPPAKSPDFLEKLAEALWEHRIESYVPTYSQELREVSRFEAQLRRAWPGDFLVSPWETFKRLDRKDTANEELRRIGLPVPARISEAASWDRYPIFMKPAEGSGGRRAGAVESEALFREYRRLYPDAGFYELIRGREYTVDCMFDGAGRLLGYNQRVRVKSLGGAVIVTQNNYDFDIQPSLKKLEESYKFCGCVNFQYILSQGRPYFIDVNLRYASGGLPLTVASGLDVPRIMLDLWSGRRPEGVRSCGADRRTMYRYFEELFEDEAGDIF